MTAQINRLKAKGYYPLTKSGQKTGRPNLMTEWNARKIVMELHSQGHLAQAVKSGKFAPIGGSEYWMIMFRKRRK